jgi:hypothetical protein
VLKLLAQRAEADVRYPVVAGFDDDRENRGPGDGKPGVNFVRGKPRQASGRVTQKAGS